MNDINTENQAPLREWIYFSLVGIRGQALGSYYRHILTEDRSGISRDTSARLLRNLFIHCKESVPYYAKIIQEVGDSYLDDPIDYLHRIPILSRDLLRKSYNELKSSDLHRRRWFLNTTGGSTGDPIRFIQDREYAARSGAITLLFSKLAGREFGESELYLWGSERDIIRGSEKWQARLIHKLTNSSFINAFRMTPETMRGAISLLNQQKPKLIVAYVDSIYALARFVEREGLAVVPQIAIMTSAGTLYPFMREKIERVFQCRVFNRYGAREVGDIACERPGLDGLWVAPWGNYIEIIDKDGNLVTDGTEGDILVTSLTNYAMPLIRYRIGDRGILTPSSNNYRYQNEQVFENITGRTTDIIITKNGDIVHGGYFMVLLFYRDWILHYQVVQKSYSHLVFRIIKSDSTYQQSELDEITKDSQIVMGDDCKIEFKFVNEISPSPSGKYRYIISEL